MSEEQPAVVVKELNKSFKLPHDQHSGLKQLIVNFAKRKKGYEIQKVLEDVSFDIKKGEFFGIVGRNGSGKSTLLKLLAGIYAPDSGLVQVNGSLTPFIELGVGFNPELTGRENIFLNGALLGFSRREIEDLYDDIVTFAELERFMDQKLKNYSSGMQVRLAFSIAIRADTDILLLDEVLAVGDSIFQQKCFKYFKQLKKMKKTVILVSHDANILKEYCTSGVLLEKGHIISQGNIKTVVNDYVGILNEIEDSNKVVTENSSEWGNGMAEVISGMILDTNGSTREVFTDNDTKLKVQIEFKAYDTITNPVYGLVITDASGASLFESNTLWSEVATKELLKNSQVAVTWEIPNFFNTGDFSISPAIADKDGSVIYNWKDSFLSFKIRKTIHSGAYTNVKHEILIGKS